MVHRLTLSYRGDRYAGWQRQENALAIQQVVEEALERLLGGRVRVFGAGRTDAGVHARGQEAHLAWDGECELRSLVHGTNHFLPEDIRVMRAFRMPAGFDARRSARAKEYRYRWIDSPVLSPLDAPFAAPLPRGADTGRMEEAARRLLGRHDFSCFANAGGAHGQPVREILQVSLVRSGALVELRLTGDGFLRGMVRTIAGTLAEVGLGRRSAGDLARLLDGGERSCAGPTAPARGLVLERVDYDEAMAPLAAEPAGCLDPLAGTPGGAARAAGGASAV